ncbi:MAG: 4-hydroxybenzoate octaprenyltransferase [Burkholderiales bacterium]|nr:4-hydroxybenzoate octaprenyltransferase [Burkholderiales bacterium]
MIIKNILSLIRFNKPIGTILLLCPTLSALVVAARGIPPLYAILVFSSGVFLIRSAGCAINDALDANFDKYVARTKDRPVATGKIKKNDAILVSMMLSLVAFIISVIYLKPKTLGLAVVAGILFMTYPFMKRFFSLPQLYLGIAYSFGILMAFIEINGKLDILTGLLFIANLVWVFGYDTIYALVDRADDLKIGIKTSAITLDNYVVIVISLCYITCFTAWLLVGIILHLGIAYFIILAWVGGLLLYQVIILIKARTEFYFRLFLLNGWVGLAVFVGLIMGFI